MDNRNPIQQETPKVNIKYHRADRTKRVMARIIDLFICAALGVIFFFSVRSIVQTTPSYKNREERIHLHKTESGVYRKRKGKDIDLVSYYKDNKDVTEFGKKKFYQEGLTTFLSYCKEKLPDNEYKEIKTGFDEYLLKANFKDVPRFVLVDNQISENKECQAKWADYNKVYEDYFDVEANKILYNYFPQYQKDIHKESIYRIALELPIAVVLSSFLTYRLPGLIRKRGRKTIGRLIYKIGLTERTLLHVRTGRYLAYGFIRRFAIISLSFLTFGIPLIIDISRFAFTKNRQDFGEYRLGLYEIDDSIEPIYYSLAEATRSHSSGKKISAAFSAPNQLDE